MSGKQSLLIDAEAAEGTNGGEWSALTLPSILGEDKYEINQKTILDAMGDSPETGVVIEVPQHLQPTGKRDMHLTRVESAGHEIGVIIRSSLHNAVEAANATRNSQALKHAQAQIDPHTGELNNVFGGLYIDTLTIHSFARDPLRILAPNVTINNLIIACPMLAPWIDYSQDTGNHLDLILQSYVQSVHVGGLEALLVPSNVTINNIQIRCDSDDMWAKDAERLYLEGIGTSGIMLSSPVHYKNWKIGTQRLDIQMPVTATTWLNAEHLSESVIGSTKLIPYFKHQWPILIKSRKMPEEIAPSDNNLFLNLPETQAVNYNGLYANITEFSDNVYRNPPPIMIAEAGHNTA